MSRIILKVMFVFLLMPIFPVHAKTDISIAVVDVEQILLKSKPAISVQKQVEKKRKAFLNDVKKKENALLKAQKEIESQRAKLTKEEFLKKAQAFEKKRIESHNDIQKKKTALDKAYATAMNKITKTIVLVSEEVASERKIDLVITRQNIIVGSMSLDITKDVIARVNKKLPNLKLKIK